MRVYAYNIECYKTEHSDHNNRIMLNLENVGFEIWSYSISRVLSHNKCIDLNKDTIKKEKK